MADLSTNYLGIPLKNPLVPSASPLTKTLDDARLLEDAGAAAVVMHSLFEEALREEEGMLDRFFVEPVLGNPEARDFLPIHPDFQGGLDTYLDQLRKLKESLEIPVVASLNGVSLSGWIDYGRELQSAGADALELNVYYLPADLDESGDAVEGRYLALLDELRAVVSLPIVMKLSPYFSSLPNFVRLLESRGARGVALFNRFYQPDLDIETLEVKPTLKLSTSAETLLRVQWLAILRGRVDLTLAATGGVHSAEDALKMIFAGADVVHMTSSLLLHGPAHLSHVLTIMNDWLDEHEYASVAEMKGAMSQGHVSDPAAFARANYVRVLDSFTSPGSVRR